MSTNSVALSAPLHVSVRLPDRGIAFIVSRLVHPMVVGNVVVTVKAPTLFVIPAPVQLLIV